MEVSVLIIIALVVVVFVLGLFLTKLKNNRYGPYISIAIAVFFLIYGIVNREYLYPSLFCCLLGVYTGIRSLLSRKRA